MGTVGTVRRTFAYFRHGLADVLYPAHCLGCGLPIAGETGVVCPACRAKLIDENERRCPRCAGLVGSDAVKGSCPDCRRSPGFRFGTAAAVGIYDGDLRELVLEFKYRRAWSVGRHLARELAGAVRRRGLHERDPVVVAVPLHWWKRLKRGFNQAERLAEHLSDDLGLRCARGALVAVRPTADQIGLMRAERRRNVQGAFRVRRPGAVADRHVLLVDDVMTTGATLNECTRVLKAAGARSVSVAIAARSRGA